MKHIYADILKAEEQSDGSIIVSGYASAPTADSDGETVTTAAMAAALPDYMKFGAVREMHQPKAAGTAIEARIEEATGNTFFSAHVVDSEAVKKVKQKVYKGFSIGGKVLSRDADDPNIITGIKLVEVSLVDRPANPDSVFTMYKADDGGGPHPPEELAAISQLTALVDAGQILPSQLLKLAATFTKGEQPMELQKSLWNVADLAALLGSLKCVQSSMAFDAACEGEVSASSLKLKQLITDLAQILVELIGEEVEDMKSAAEVVKEEDMTDKKIEADEEAKAAAAAATTETKAEEAVDTEDDTDEGDEPKEKGKKRPGKDEGHDPKAKKSEDTGDLVKMITTAVVAAIEPLQKRITELEARPAPSKAVLKVVGKGQDIEKGEKELGDEPPSGLSPAEQAAWEIKKLHRAGGLL